MGLLFASHVSAWGPPPGYAPGESGKSEHYGNAGLCKLNLSDEQKTKIETLFSARQKELRPLRKRISDKSAELCGLWLQPNPDRDKIAELQKEVSVLRDGIQKKTTALRLEVRNILTPEQQKKLDDSGWGKGSGFGPRGRVRGYGVHEPGMDLYQR